MGLQAARKMSVGRGAAQVIEFMGELGMVAFEPFERFGKRPKPARFDKRLAREAKQTVEIFRGETNCPLGTLRRPQRRSRGSLLARRPRNGVRAMCCRS